MKAAVIFQHGEMPQYLDFPEPIPQHDDEILVRVKAVAIKHFDKGRASGSHYSASAARTEGHVIGGDGICLLENGDRVYAIGVSGMLAEKATIDKDRCVPIPDGLSDVIAAALPNAVIGAAMGLKYKASIQPGDVVLINGATGFTGRVAVQLAKYYGAKKIIVTGRNQQSLADTIILGADESISLLQDDQQLKDQLDAAQAGNPVDIVIDYLWGHSAELILASLKGKGHFTNRVRYVSIGSVTGDTIQLSAANLRSVNLQLSGSGLGAWTREQVGQLFSAILPEMFRLAAEGKLQIQTTSVKLEDIATLWQCEVPDGNRLVVTL